MKCQNVSKLDLLLRGIGWRLSQQSGDHVEVHHFNFCLKLRFARCYAIRIPGFNRSTFFFQAEVPKNIWEQLHKAANSYFLLISFIMFIGCSSWRLMSFFLTQRRNMLEDVRICEDFCICWTHLYAGNLNEPEFPQAQQGGEKAMSWLQPRKLHTFIPWFYPILLYISCPGHYDDCLGSYCSFR